MRGPMRAGILAGSLLLGVAPIALLPTMTCAADISISFNTFHDELAPYGDWVYSDRWGEVWVPDVPADFHPYDTDGHWVYTEDYGWTWVSDYPWGDIAFHYGRWVNDPDDGWIWIPGYVWSPAWVVWRSSGRYLGWMPMPPDENFLQGGTFASVSAGRGGLSFSINFGDLNGYYGYSRWYGRDYDEDRFASNWVFVPTGHVADRDFHQYTAPRTDYRTILRDTRNVTNYTVVNNYVVNRSIDPHVVERAGGRVEPVQATAVIRHPQFITNVNVGRDVQMRARSEIPHGTGEAGSAPKPPPSVIQTLSTKVPVHNGQKPAHLFTRDTITQAPLANKPATPPNGMQNNTAAPSNAMPNEMHGHNGMNGPMENAKPGTENGKPGTENNPAGTAPPSPLPGTTTAPSTNTGVNPGANTNMQTGPGAETHHGVRERRHGHAPGSETTTTPETGTTPPTGTETTTPGSEGKHLGTTKRHVNDRNAPTMPTNETPTTMPGSESPATTTTPSGRETHANRRRENTEQNTPPPSGTMDRTPPNMRGHEPSSATTNPSDNGAAGPGSETNHRPSGRKEKQPKPDQNNPPPQ